MYSWVSLSQVILVVAMVYIALFSRLSPERLRLCLVVLPEEAGMGLTLASAANAASERIRSGWDQAARHTASEMGPYPV